MFTPVLFQGNPGPFRSRLRFINVLGHPMIFCPTCRRPRRFERIECRAQRRDGRTVGRE